MSFKYFFQQNKIKFNNNFNFIPNNNKFLNKSQLKIIKIIIKKLYLEKELI